MSVNYKAWVGWGFYGAASARSRANLWSSWGMLVSLPSGLSSRITCIVDFYRRLRT
jgi:hypothetical protein